LLTLEARHLYRCLILNQKNLKIRELIIVDHIMNHMVATIDSIAARRRMRFIQEEHWFRLLHILKLQKTDQLHQKTQNMAESLAECRKPCQLPILGVIAIVALLPRSWSLEGSEQPGYSDRSS
jgi:hypothetical protein